MGALEYLPEEITGDERFYPGVVITDTLEVYEILGRRMTAYYNERFLEFKMHRKYGRQETHADGKGRVWPCDLSSLHRGLCTQHIHYEADVSMPPGELPNS